MLQDFKRKEDLMKPVKLVFSPKGQTMESECPQCGKMFKCLDLHMKEVCIKKESPKDFQVCSKVSRQQTSTDYGAINSSSVSTSCRISESDLAAVVVKLEPIEDLPDANIVSGNEDDQDKVEDIEKAPALTESTKDSQVKIGEFFILKIGMGDVAPSASSVPFEMAPSGQKRKLLNMEDGDNFFYHHFQHSSQRKVYSNKRLRLNHPLQSNNKIPAIGLKNSSDCLIPSFNASATATPSRVHTNSSNALFKAQCRPVILSTDPAVADQQTTASSSKKNYIRSNDEDENIDNEERFLKAFEEKQTYSKAELARETKLPTSRVNQLVAKYCDKVSPGNSQSKVFLKPEFRIGKTAQQHTVLFISPIPTAVLFALPCSSSLLLLPSSSTGKSLTNNPSATVCLAEKDVDERAVLPSSPSAAATTALTAPSVSVTAAAVATKVNTFRKIACKRQASDEDSRNNSIGCISFISSTSAAEMAGSNNEKISDNEKCKVSKEQTSTGHVACSSVSTSRHISESELAEVVVKLEAIEYLPDANIADTEDIDLNSQSWGD